MTPAPFFRRIWPWRFTKWYSHPLLFLALLSWMALLTLDTPRLLPPLLLTLNALFWSFLVYRVTPRSDWQKSAVELDTED
ncbi:MAG: hypothetical protein SOW44_07610 [Porphyromonas sp.]|nr:hypothetical protein [Bacteroidales bacterium]MDD7559678.1 hypothetical protein [Bacteroidales bacterium]MDY3101187.1 hypothetical protein [Porphyromonas sp.]